MAEIQLPEGIKRLLEGVPQGLPFEKTIDRGLNRLADTINASRLTKKLRGIHSQLPSLPEQRIATPLGEFKLPPVGLPVPGAPEVDNRKRQAIKAALGDDISGLIEKIPVVGAVVAPLSDFLEDTAMAKVNEALTHEEYETFKKYDKISPLTTLAMLQTFLRR